MTWVAPISSALARRISSGSLTTTLPAPLYLATLASSSPTGPAPTMNTLSPGSRPARFTALYTTEVGSTVAASSRLTLSGSLYTAR